MNDNHDDNTPETPAPRRSFRKWLLTGLMLLLLSLASGAYWLIYTPSGLLWLLTTASSATGGALAFSGVSGSLQSLQAQSIAYREDALHAQVQDLTFRWQPQRLLTGDLVIEALTARDVALHTVPAEEEEPATMPESLRIPLGIAIDKLGILSLRIFTLGNETPDLVLTHLALRLESDGRLHRVRTFTLEHEAARIAGNLLIGADSPFDLSGQLVLHSWPGASSEADLPGHAALRLAGNLTQTDVMLAIKDGPLAGQGRLRLHPFAKLPLSMLHLAVSGLNPHRYSPDLPQADLNLQSELKANETGPLQGHLHINNPMARPLDQEGLPLRELRTLLAISDQTIALDALAIRLSGQDSPKGSLSGNLLWRIEDQSGSASIEVTQLDPATLDTSLRPAKLSGKLQFDGDSSAQQGHITLHDKAQRLNLEMALSHAAAAVTIETLKLVHGDSSLSGHGRLQLDEAQPFTFEGLLKQFDVSAFVDAPRSDLNAGFKLAGQLAPEPVASMDFTIKPSHFANQPLSGQGTLKLDHPQRLQSDTRLRLGDNRLELKGRLGQAKDQLLLTLTAPNLAQLGVGLQGNLDARITLTGMLDRPGLAFDIGAQRINFQDAHQLAQLKAKGSLHGTAIGLDLQASDYRMGTETYFQTLSVGLTGTQARHRLSLKSDIDPSTQAQFQASGGLSIDDQASQPFQWRGAIEQLAMTGTVPFELATRPAVLISPELVTLGAARILVANGEVNLHETRWTPRQWSTQGAFTHITLRPNHAPADDFEPLRLGGSWQLAADQQLNGRVRIQRERGDLALPLETPFAVGLETLSLTLLAESNNLNGQLAIRGKHIGDTSAQISLPLQPTDTAWEIAQDARLDGNLRFDLPDLAWLGPVLDDNLRSGGRLAARVALAGTFEQPALQGDISGEALTVTLLDEGLHLQDGKLAIRLDQDTLQLDTLNFTAPLEKLSKDRLLRNLKLARQSGKLDMQGDLNLRTQQSTLTIELDHLPLVQQTERWIVVSGNSQVGLKERMLDIQGKIVSNVGFLRQPEKGMPGLADDVVIISQTETDPKAAGLQVNLDATLDLGDQFFLRASGLEGRLAGQLRVRSRPGKALRATGSIATRDTRFEAYGQQLLVRRGIVNFDGPLDNPGLNILAVRSTLPPGATEGELSGMVDHQRYQDAGLTALEVRSTAQVEAGVEVTGTVRRPQIRLVSRPEVPDSEKLAWIVLGRAPDAGGLDSALLLSAAGSIFGGQADEGIMDNISRGLGLDEFSIRQRSGEDALTGQVGMVGKRLSERAYLSYERGLTATSAGIARLTYSLFPNISVVTRAGEDSSVDLFYNFEFD